tara:strand:+ start:1983 stop:2426 length:444 start_codon:yes stop_codon:yes gene_type:complete
MKINYCLVGLTLLFSSIWMHIMKKDNEVFQKFNKILDNEQKNKYSKIVTERLFIYVTGMIIGLLIGYYYYIHNREKKYILCKILIIIYSIKLGFYYFFPKSPLMLYSLKSKEQTDAWADIYSEMKNRWIKSLFLGFISYLFLIVSFK